MTKNQINSEAAQKCLIDSLRLINEGKNEQVIRDSFTSYLRHIFPDQPNWVIRHIQGSEAAVKIKKHKKTSTGFVDNLVDLTAIEYESDLTKKAKFNEGFGQVKDYCSALINKSHDPELIIGILSDTVRWLAYEVDISNLPAESASRENIELKEIEFIDCTSADDTAVFNLINFLKKYLGRIGSRPVSAYSIAKDLGFNSPFCQEHLTSINKVIIDAFKSNIKYSQMITELWCSFVTYFRDDGAPDQFNIETYIDEYYVLTLGKLICANFIENKALVSSEVEIRKILNGKFFENRDLINFVEYDYFGWLNSDPFVSAILPIAKAIQEDLVAYNFTAKIEEDLFGRMLAHLASRSQRILLGQEWTPSWLAKKLVDEVIQKIPNDIPLQLIDMCCGSGSMIVATIHTAKKRISSLKVESEEEKVQLLVQSITGFDIDPLAVMLSKINWILAALDWLQQAGTFISIPVYHADSLFAITPISNHREENEQPVFILKIAEYSINLPGLLITPMFKRLFDSIIDVGYNIAIQTPTGDVVKFNNEILEPYLKEICDNLGFDLQKEVEPQIIEFLREFIEKVNILNSEGRNGIWAYILRNSFRPGLVAGQFNGLVSNPPWLALSKIANNPYQQILKQKAEIFNIKPPGSSHLHIELASIFLLHSTLKYLLDGAPIGCILPETILNGHHHNPFRKYQYYNSKLPVKMDVKMIWKVPKEVFKNKAIVYFGKRITPNTRSASPIPGGYISANEDFIKLKFYRNSQGNRTAWSEQKHSGNEGFFQPASFRQGADIMPRNLLFYETFISPNPNYTKIKSINPLTSELAFTVKDAKKHQHFTLRERLIPNELLFNVATSNLLTPFHLAHFQKALLPIKKNQKRVWVSLTNNEINLKGAIARNTFGEIARTMIPTSATIQSLFDQIDTRGKLSQQIINEGGFLVFTGAGGGKVCSAYISASSNEIERLIIDQTLYWAQVNTEDEAIYLSGLLNSQAINKIIEDFQPRGNYGKRHVHKLPFGVTPPYDNSQTAHLEVVVKTSNLLNEFNKLMAHNKEILSLLNPNVGSLSSRRRKLFSHLVSLKCYQEYEAACESLYGI